MTVLPASEAPPRTSWRHRRTLVEAAVTFALLAVILVGYSSFLAFNETRAGSVLNDPLLALFPAADFSAVTFTAIYGAIVLAVASRVRRPEALLMTVQCYAVLMVVRVAAMYLMPLAPPATMIPLYDPLAGLGPGAQMRQDLFFSGHTATMFLLYLTARGRPLRAFFLVCTALIAALVLLQHCHYSIDVLAAPFFAYACYRMVMAARKDESG